MSKVAVKTLKQTVITLHKKIVIFSAHNPNFSVIHSAMPKKGNKEGSWPKICKHGKCQSPVPLTKKFAYHVDIPPINLQNFQVFNNIQVTNTGGTVSLSLPEACHCNSPKLSGGGLVRPYTLENIHFHWPSEHVIDGVRYFLEAHFVFYADRYETFKKALEHPYGITVMAILFSRTNFTRSKNFRTIADAVKLVSNKPGSSTISRKGIDLYQFLPYDHELFYHYRGSLTTPPCSEFVHWLVFKNASNISYFDLKDLSHIYNHEKELVDSNNRELQNPNGRIISIRHIL